MGVAADVVVGLEDGDVVAAREHSPLVGILSVTELFLPAAQELAGDRSSGGSWGCLVTAGS